MGQPSAVDEEFVGMATGGDPQGNDEVVRSDSGRHTMVQMIVERRNQHSARSTTVRIRPSECNHRVLRGMVR